MNCCSDARTVTALREAGIPVAEWERTEGDDERSSRLVIVTPLRSTVGARETYRLVLAALTGDMTPLMEIEARAP